MLRHQVDFILIVIHLPLFNIVNTRYRYFLNDDYEGGEFVLPEYGLKVKPKANTAFIFPGISTHQVLPVTKGTRMTIISFFVNGSIKPQYKMKAHYYKDKKIVDSQIYPL